jgi:putative chitinase
VIDRDYFFDKVRPLFGGHLDDSQVAGMNAVLLEWEKWAPLNDALSPNLCWLGYAFATAMRETGGRMVPVREIGLGRGHSYGIPDPATHQVYYGRGLVQITWRANYATQAERLGIDLLGNPDLALDPNYAANIMIDGMATGAFTGRRLAEYFGDDPAKDDSVNARRVINGLDHADLVSQYFKVFNNALKEVTS